MGYGKSKYGSDQKFQKTGKPGKGPGNNFVRVMPAMHSLADEGKWAVYRTTHWGYAGVSKSDPTKNVVRPFLCIEDRDFRTKFVRQACPECEDFRAKEKEAEAYEATLKAKGLNEKQIKEDPEMKVYAGWLQAHAPERKWYINVKYKDGTFGDYKINHKTHKKGIDAKIQELLENNDIDALDLDQGVWFNIKRLGDGFSVPDVVEVEQRPVEGKKGQMEFVMAPLTPEEQERGLKECRDLATLGGAVLTESQIAALVNSDGSPEAVDKIFAGATGTASAAPSVARAASQVVDRDEEDQLPESLGGPVSAPAAAPAAPVITPEMKARAEQILAKKKAEADAKLKAEEAARRAAAAVAASKAAEAPAPAAEAPAENAQNPLDMDDAAFLQFFNSQQSAS